MLKSNTSPKSPRIEISNDTFAERNIVKFPHTNRKHFTIIDPIAFPIVKMENNNPQNVPFWLDYGDPHLIQQCLGPPQAPAETEAPTVEALSHTYAVKSPLVTMVRSKFAPKSTPSRGPVSYTHLTLPTNREV